jgi:hypothetical protein
MPGMRVITATPAGEDTRTDYSTATRILSCWANWCGGSQAVFWTILRAEYPRRPVSRLVPCAQRMRIGWRRRERGPDEGHGTTSNGARDGGVAPRGTLLDGGD